MFFGRLAHFVSCIYMIRLGIADSKKLFFVLYCSRLSLYFHNIGFGSALQIQKNVFFVLHCSRLSLYFHNIGFGSALQIQKNVFFVLHCSRLSLYFHNIGFGSALQIQKMFFLFCIALAFHYICKRINAQRQYGK